MTSQDPHRMVLTGYSPWPHEDVYSCLYSCLGTVLAARGLEPTRILGAYWDFFYRPGDFRREEFYHPCRLPDVGRSLMPYHPIGAVWHTPSTDEEAWESLKAAVSRGVAPIVAVDNYYLPFRPAFQDVHANHLVVVFGYDEPAGEVMVVDPTPPGHHGLLPAGYLRRARGSVTPGEGRDQFFADTPVDRRWLKVTIDGPGPALSPAWVGDVLVANAARFLADPEDDTSYAGLSGLRRYLLDLAERAAGEDAPAALEEAYVVGWPLQGQTALHAAFLRETARALSRPRLAELGRQVDRLTHHWTAFRMTAGHGRSGSLEIRSRLARRARELVSDTERVVHEMLDLAACGGCSR